MQIKLKFIFILVLGLPMFISCDTDFDPNAEWKDITVVYGMLNQNDSITYLKINKAFLGPGNALEFAKNEDSSSYHGNLEVKLIEYLNGSPSGKILYFDTTTIYNKEPGLFYAPKQVLWRCVTKNQFNENATYKLEILNKKTGGLITSESPIINSFEISKPRKIETSIDISSNVQKTIEWRSAKNGKIYQALIVFNYTEISNGDTSYHKVKFALPSQKSLKTDGSETMVNYYKGEELYRNISTQVPYKDNIKRYAGKLEFIITVGGDELNNYIDITKPSSSIVQERPEYSNISNGLGIFSCRYDNSVYDERVLSLNNYSLDSLYRGQYTKNLGFRPVE